MSTLKKIVFINPAVNKYANVAFWASSVMNLLMDNYVTTISKPSGMILAALTPEKYEFVFVDEEIEEIDFFIDADLVAITAMTVQAKRAFQIAERFRSVGKTVVIGGIHASVCPDETLEHCDVIAMGEGENTWPEILKDFERDELKKIYNAKDYPPVDKLVVPKIDVIKHDHYLLFPILATRGCPYDCDFCSIKFSAGHRYRMKPVQQVIEEIKAFEKYNVTSLGAYKKSYMFMDDNLYVNRDYAKELFKAMAGLGIAWTGQGTVNMAFDDEMLDLMAASGCRGYSIGFESISEETLKEANKPKINKAGDYKEAIENLIKHGIIPAGFFIFGFDSDDPQIIERTVDFAIQNHLIQPFFNILTPYPGTRVSDKIEAEGRVFDRNWDNYNSSKCVFTPKQIHPSTLEAGTIWANKQLARLDIIVEQLKYFYGHGPWSTIKPLGLKERIALYLVGLRLRGYNKEYSKFLYWAARQKHINDFGALIAAVVYNDMARKIVGNTEEFEKTIKTVNA